MSQMNPKEAFHHTVYLVQLPYIAGHSLSVHLSKHFCKYHKAEVRTIFI